MTLHKKILYISTLALFCGIHPAHGQVPKETARYYNGPTVAQVTATTAVFDIPYAVQAGFMVGDSERTYFEYYKTNQVCPAILDSKFEIAISPVPEYCQPKQIGKGTTSSDMTQTVTGLLPGTKYSVVFKRDTRINCITTPCPTDEFTSLTTNFTTLKTGEIGEVAQNTYVYNLGFGAQGAEVKKLQQMLILKNFLSGNATGYYGRATQRAVIQLQRSLGVQATGYFGKNTRAKSNNKQTIVEETFTGRVTAVSIGCFYDATCSITIDGKEVITTVGWSRDIAGSVIGTAIGDVQVGSYAKVFAKKIPEGYTLYGNANYYVEILYFK